MQRLILWSFRNYDRIMQSDNLQNWIPLQCNLLSYIFKLCLTSYFVPHKNSLTFSWLFSKFIFPWPKSKVPRIFPDFAWSGISLTYLWPRDTLLTYYHVEALTHLPLNKMAVISQTIYSDAFSWMKSFVLWSKFRWSLFLRVQWTITQHWSR